MRNNLLSSTSVIPEEEINYKFHLFHRNKMKIRHCNKVRFLYRILSDQVQSAFFIFPWKIGIVLCYLLEKCCEVWHWMRNKDDENWICTENNNPFNNYITNQRTEQTRTFEWEDNSSKFTLTFYFKINRKKTKWFVFFCTQPY